MAISVKQFKNLLDCPEPQYEINIAYHADAATGASEICNGNGTLTNVYGDFATLSDLYSNSATGNAATTDICDEGMDVVFVVDYTGSMGGAINGVKTGIAQIAQEINTQTSGNYRLGLVLYDEYDDTGIYSTLQYASSGFYQNLPSDQKIIETNTTAGKKQVYTCIEKMDVVGNIGDASSGFTQGLNALNAATNSSTGMKLGNGRGAPEPGGIASYKAAADAFAGQWRSGVLKLIIHITDNYPGGDDDHYNSTDVQYFQNTLTPALDNNNIQFFHNSDAAATANENVDTYKYVVENTTPAGLGNYSVNYNSTWYNAIITGIQTLCDETTTYTCDPAPAGWYADVPVVAGTTVVYYWDGSAWTNSYSCPAPQYTVYLDVVDAITNGSVDDFPVNQANQYDLDTFEYGPAVAGTVFTSTIQCSVDSGYQNLSLNVSNISDTNVVTSTSVNNGTLEVTVQVTIGNANSTESIQINGTASQIPRTLVLDVINGVQDNFDANGDAQSPAGYITIEPQDPVASGWTNMESTYTTYAERYTFTGVAGSTHSLEVGFDRLPADYDLDVTSVTVLGFNGSNAGGPNYAAAINAMSNVSLTTGNQANASYSGNITMPNENVYVRVYVYGQVDQPDFRYTVYASETITGASIVGSNSTTFEGYTGEVFSFSKQVQADSGYTGVSVSGVQLNNAYSGNAALSSLGYSNAPPGAGCTVTMPAGGGSGGIIISGSATAIEYDYVITILDGFSQAAWGQVTLTGVAGSTPSATATSINNPGYTFNATSISGGEPGVLNASITNASSMELGLSLQAMPLGGGSATITVNGSQTAIQYTYELDITTDQVVVGSWASNSATLTGSVGQVITGTFNFNQATDITYSSTGHSTDDSAITSTSYTGVNNLFSTNYEVTMPLGGGSGTITCDDAQSTPTQYTYNIYFDDSQLSNSANMSLIQSEPQVITGSAGSQTNFEWGMSPSPSYYQISIALGNITTHDGSGNSATASELAIGSISGQNPTVIYGTLTMPSGGGTGYVRPKGGVTNPTFRFIVDAATQIGNTSIASPTSKNFDGVVGSTFSHTFDVVSNSGYTHDVTGVNIANNYSNSLSASPTVSEDMEVNLTMPIGGGQTTVTATGTSQLVAVGLVINFAENPSIADLGAWDDTSLTFNGLPGDTFSISNYWRTVTGKEFTSASSTSITITGADGNGNTYPGTDPFNGTLGTSEPTSGDNARTTGTLTMPMGGGTYVVTFNSSRIEDEEYTITYDKNSSSATGSTAATTGALPLTVANNGFTLLGSTFDEWNTKSSGGGTGYAEGATYNVQADDVLYAQWTACACDINASAPTPSTYGGTTTISVIVLDACVPTYSWSINGVAVTPVAAGPLEYEFRNYSAGTYTIQLTDSNGCVATDTITISNPITTQPPIQYYYHTVRDCNGGSNMVARSTSSTVQRFQLWQVGLTEPGGPEVVTILSANIPETSHDITITQRVFDCPDPGGGGDPEAPGGGPEE